MGHPPYQGLLPWNLKKDAQMVTQPMTAAAAAATIASPSFAAFLSKLLDNNKGSEQHVHWEC
jgi:hypothetical protein